MKQRSNGREFYTHKPAYSPTGCLPPLSYSLTTPRDSGHDRAIITPTTDSTVLNQSLQVLASRIGCIQQLPELHVLIQDTVNSTLKSIKGVIEAQVNRQLETDKLGIVEDMVSRLLTEEVIKITHQSAHALTRREVEHISSNQSQLQESVAATGQAWTQRFENAEKMRLELDARVKDLTSKYDRSLQRLEEAEMGLTRMRAALPSADEVKEQIGKLSEKIDKAAIREDEHVRDLSQLEERCRGLYTTKVEFKELVVRTDGLSACQENHGESWLTERLKPYVLDEVMTQGLAKTREQSAEAVSRLQESINRDLDEVRRSTFMTTRDLGETKSSKRDTLELHEESKKARADLERELREEIASLKTAIYAHIDEAVEAQHNEREKLSDTFHVAQSEVQSESAELHTLLGVAREQIEKHHERFETVVCDVGKLSADITSLSEQHAKIREGFTDEKMRCEAIFSQQQHNRSELNFMIQRTNDVELLRADIKACQASVEDHTERIHVLGEEVSQWEHAIEAQQGLRREAAQLRDGVEKNRQAMDLITQQQIVGISNLRTLHNHWLQGNAEQNSAQCEESQRKL